MQLCLWDESRHDANRFQKVMHNAGIGKGCTFLSGILSSYGYSGTAQQVLVAYTVGTLNVCPPIVLCDLIEWESL